MTNSYGMEKRSEYESNNAANSTYCKMLRKTSCVEKISMRSCCMLAVVIIFAGMACPIQAMPGKERRAEERSSTLIAFPRVGRSVPDHEYYTMDEEAAGEHDSQEIASLHSSSSLESPDHTFAGSKIRSKRQALIPFPRTGKRSSALIPFPRTGKRAALVAFPRTGKRAALMAFPRTGKRVFGPRTGKRASLIAMPRTGKRSSLFKHFDGFGYGSFPQSYEYKRGPYFPVVDNSLNDETGMPLRVAHESETLSDLNEHDDEDSKDAKNMLDTEVDSRCMDWLQIQKKEQQRSLV